MQGSLRFRMDVSLLKIASEDHGAQKQLNNARAHHFPLLDNANSTGGNFYVEFQILQQVFGLCFQIKLGKQQQTQNLQGNFRSQNYFWGIL